MRVSRVLLLVAGLSLSAAAADPPNDKKDVAPAAAFEASVRPLFQAKCWRCHGEAAQKAGLDLRTAAGALRGGESGAAVVPGRPDQSLLYEKVHDGAMPPAKKDRLSESEVAAVRRWIEARAPGDAATPGSQSA